MKIISLMQRLVMVLIFLLGSVSLFAQQVVVRGIIKDASGETIIGASILELGTTNGTVTDYDGNFEIKVTANAKLQVSYLGYQTQDVIASTKAPMVIILQEDSYALGEVVAIGYGSQKKKEITGSVASVKAEDFNAGVKNSPMGLLQGKVAGLNITRTGGGDPTNTGYNIQIRGFST